MRWGITAYAEGEVVFTEGGFFLFFSFFAGVESRHFLIFGSQFSFPVGAFLSRSTALHIMLFKPNLAFLSCFSGRRIRFALVLALQVGGLAIIVRT